ncbi:MAG: type II and III secretion system protein family protein [Desulfurivibrionaceae bacterium]|nr:type II and III secretion system protein family protein [Desulfurivibrionaceae bacterium]
MKNQRATLFCKMLMLLVVSGLLFSVGAAAAEVDRQTLQLKLGGSDIIKTIAPFKRVTIANPGIADVVVLSPSEMYVYGKKVGFTSMILWEEGKEKTVLDVVIALDITALKEQLYELYPNEDVQVYASETGVVLSGTVSGPEVVEQVLRLTRTFLPVEAKGQGDTGGSGRSGAGITNLLNVGNLQQVMLEVTFAEVSRDSGRDLQVGMGLNNMNGDLGSDFTKGSAGIGNLGVDNFGNLAAQAAQSLLFNFAGNAANIFVEIDRFTAALQFLESEGLARTLAEPRLVTQSGQEASFLAGGEYPIPVVQSGGVDNNNVVTIEFKEFGVGLAFTPVVMSNGKISLQVSPSVSTITDTASTSGGTVPILTTRKLNTNVQLQDGQTLALAGLLQDNMRDVVRKVPLLGDIPILGALFRSTSYIQDKTDLLIAVTPHLVKPGPEGSITFPGENIQIPNRYEFYLEGRLEGRRSDDDEPNIKSHKFSEMPAESGETGGMEGKFGYQPVKADSTKGE